MAVGNSFNYVGRLTDVPELKEAGSAKVCHFSLASNVYRKGENVAIFPMFEAWNDTAERICAMCKKGKRIGVSARYDENAWVDKDGHNRRTPKFVVESFMFLDTKDDDESTPDSNVRASTARTASTPASDIIADDSDDLPF